MKILNKKKSNIVLRVCESQQIRNGTTFTST